MFNYFLNKMNDDYAAPPTMACPPPIIDPYPSETLHTESPLTENNQVNFDEQNNQTNKKYSPKKNEIFQYKINYPDPSKRREDCQKIMASNPGKVPIICEKAPNSKIKQIEKTKFVVDSYVTLSQFSLLIKKKCEMSHDSSLYLLVNGKIALQGNLSLSEVYEKYRDPEDDILYIIYASEVTWGNK